MSFLFSTSGTLATLPLRAALGIIFLLHGIQKVFGFFGGPGFDEWINTPVSLPLPQGVPSVKFWLACAAVAELVCGLFVLVGFLTRIAAFVLMVIMTVAMYFVHWKYGFFMSANGPDGIEYVLALFCMAFALVVEGGGRFSADAHFSG